MFTHPYFTTLSAAAKSATALHNRRGGSGASSHSALRRILTLIAAVGLVWGLSACNRDSATVAGGGSVTFALSTQTNPFFVQLREGAEEKADELGVALNIQDASDDSAVQTNQLNNAATMGTHVVIVNPTDSDAVVPAVKTLNAASIPVIAVDRTANGGELASFIASDNVAGGKQAAEVLAHAIAGEGEIVVLQGIAGSSASRDRGLGFEQGIAQFPNIRVIAKQTANFDRAAGLDVATNLLQAHPGVKAIFAENDEMALGAIEALGSRAGTEVMVIGFDGTADGLHAIREGRMFASIAQQPKQLGARAVEEAAKILKGEKPQKEVPVDVITVTKENVADF
ncbi:D-ribose ABC transporter substrate-binding protein [Corynebacterium felinum]|uniref:Ribose transport system substrate-binding protein n=1 Tax=Corynebacterium felinum TaxID=131318 RepID=A0ABU2B8A9_9CORY|nr:D-ribose ABC transporter substrate-binding protein [Corynebacterium felinum]MDF5820220.1 D-ribose ABC transporter substrate-binding protein [Corynebacterium felinum]MDR7354860.1 ribose transport system substrate-binding protein [Corynebacterium felinum]WJY94220.1 D-ribose-binding periplasmic protein precursor [Corynebacterium felinum]